MTLSEYRGMRWFKCDLHMHTPADPGHWRGAVSVDDGEAADRYARRCYEEGLECIAITDHNFASKAFLPQLREAAARLSDEYGYELAVFPGSEITADVGRGMHVLALFEPGMALDEIDHALTSCGVPTPRQKPDGTPCPSTSRLPGILAAVQQRRENGELKGIVICPHPQDVGLFDNERISKWLQQHEWQNPELFAVEVRKPVHEMSQGWQRLFGNGEDCHADWRRVRPMATVMSSDCKALCESDDRDNYLGKRWCWIKMSQPTIEALRQAFLDAQSRICLNPEPPRTAHAHIQSICVKNTAFLSDQKVSLSPHMNCIIGGRGSGKSSLFECMRLGLRGEVALKDTGQVANRQIERVRKTFGPTTHVELEVHHAGLEDRFVIDDPSQLARIEGREVQDPPTVFRQLGPLIFSQEEITELANRQRTLVGFIDNLARERLESHRQQAAAIVEQLSTARQMQETLNRVDRELTTLKQEVVELERQLKAEAEVQDELKRHRAAQDAQKYLQSVSDKASEAETNLEALAEELETQPPPLGSRLQDYPETTYFAEAEKILSTAYSDLATAVLTALKAFQAKVDEALSDHQDWSRVQQAIARAEVEFKSACDGKGLTPQEAERLRETEQQHRSKQAALSAKQVERDGIGKRRPDSQKLLGELAQCWQEETRERQRVLDDILASDTVPRTVVGKPIVATSLTFAGNREAFLEAWRKLAPDRRKTLGRIWDDYDPSAGRDNIGDQIFDAFQCAVQGEGAEKNQRPENEEKAMPGNPVQWLEMHWDKPSELPALLREHLSEIRAVRATNAEEWASLLVARVPDQADLTLYRGDGSRAGSFVEDDLSTGQRNTAILSLLLARGRGPVLIDQPEDELDSEFLYHELVPMLRAAKTQRQLIIVTHNANIPVNADAELVYALKAEGGHGVCRTQGGPDRHEVTQAILDIMEGSREAFQRRCEKYHF